MKDLPTPFEVGQRRTLARDLEKMRVGIARALDGDNITVGPGLFKSGYNGKVVISSRRKRGGGSSVSGRLFIGTLTISSGSLPTDIEGSDITDSIEATYFDSADPSDPEAEPDFEPKAGDTVVLEYDVGGGTMRAVLIYEIFSKAVNDSNAGDRGIFQRAISIGNFSGLAIGKQTGIF